MDAVVGLGGGFLGGGLDGVLGEGLGGGGLRRLEEGCGVVSVVGLVVLMEGKVLSVSSNVNR